MPLLRNVRYRSRSTSLHRVQIAKKKPENISFQCRGSLVDLLVDVVDIVLHCVDHNHIKNRPMTEVFAPVCQFPQVRVSRYFISSG